MDGTIQPIATDQPPRPRLAVVVPLANEGSTLCAFLERVVAQLGPDDAVFCVVDRVSRDDTRAKLDEFARSEGRVHAIWAPQDRSVVDAYFRGYREAFGSGALWILEMDGGMSHRPEEIPRFLAKIDHGYDYVGGCRFMHGGSHVGSVRRRLISRGGSILARLVLRTRMRDMTSGFEMFSRRAMEHVLKDGVRSHANFFQTEIKYLLRDWRWIEVPINYRSTKSRVAPGSVRDALRHLWKLRGRSSGAPP